ncbi:ComEC/Rec2 family competence protein [Paenibacillus sp. UNC451MF]|uniref:ComEC/Rec2 family competence protein n=1 Tax=Paenibacillus sp. UNC451MF TaxID=1449063 RepID=UPI00048E49EB|nr:MBL fold metallo-hydrolase [Paenibacillus sp. UNC451MF]
MEIPRLLTRSVAALWLTVMICSGCSKSQEMTANPPPKSSVPVDRLDGLYAASSYKGLLTVRYLDLENKEPSGDCIIIQSPDGKTMVIDAGIPEVGPQVVNALSKLGINKIDIAVNTHPHPDHIGGFDSVFKQIPVDMFYLEDEKPVEWAAYRNTMSVVQSKKIKTAYLQENDQFQLGQQVRVEVLNPRKGELPGAVKKFELDEVNNASMLLKLNYKDTSFLFTGDIHREREVELIERFGDKLKADFMDAPHHGISSSSSQSWLSTVSPKVSVISYNKFNNYKQLLNYQKNHIDTYVTAFHGQVLLTSDGNKLNVLTQKDYPAPKK